MAAKVDGVYPVPAHREEGHEKDHEPLPTGPVAQTAQKIRTASAGSMKQLADVQKEWIQVKPYGSYPRRSCALCGKQDAQTKGFFTVNGTPFQVVQCKTATCQGHMYTAEEYDEEFLREMYGDHYHYQGDQLDLQCGIRDKDPAETARRKEIATMQVREWAREGVISPDPALNRERGLRLVEVGGGSGYLSAAAQRGGLDVLNVELSEDRVEECRTRQEDPTEDTVPAFHGFLHEAVAQGVVQRDSVDVVACYDLLEHVVNPDEFLQELHTVVKPGGHIVLRLPDTPAGEGPTLHLVDHVNHFTRESLQRLLEKNGFEVVHYHHSGTFSAKDGSGRTIENQTVFARKSTALTGR